VLPFNYLIQGSLVGVTGILLLSAHMTISDTAAQRINGLCEDKPGYGLKIQVRAGGCSGLVLKMEITLPTRKTR